VNPLSAVYGAVIGARNDFYDRGTLPTRGLRGAVVSVGNIAVGGSGKTPFLIALGELLKRRGISFDVLSRGYGRATHGMAVVDPNGEAAEFGDEPLLIARKLRVPVIVGEDRHFAGHFAEKQFGTRVHLLDDGFQHRQLARDFDIVLVTPTDAEDSLLPAGRLREPVSSLARANAVVLTNDTSTAGLPVDKQLVWRVRRSIVAPAIEGPALAFCGIARPESFFEQLREAGVNVAVTRSFRDHHRYRDRHVHELAALREQHEAAAFVTTEKDAINLGSAAEELAPLYVVPVRMEIENSDAVIDAIVAAIERHSTA